MKNSSKPIKVHNTTFNVYYKPRTDEWVVRVMIDGKRNEARCYYTSDNQDALDTMYTMIKEEYEWQALNR